MEDCYQLGKLRKCLFRNKNEGMHWEQREAGKKDWGTWKTKLADLIKFIIVGPDQGETWSGKGQRRSPSPHILLKAVVAKQMAHSTFLNHFSTQSLFFFCLLALYSSSQKFHQLSLSQRKCQGFVAACASPQGGGQGTSACCGPGYRTGEAAERVGSSPK